MKNTTKIDLFVAWLLILCMMMGYDTKDQYIPVVFAISIVAFAGFLCFLVFHLPPAEDKDDDQDPKLFI